MRKKKGMRMKKMMMKGSLTLLLCACAWGQNLGQVGGVQLTTANPSPPTSCSTGITGVSGSTTYYYWPIANYPIGQAVSTTPLVVNNAPDTLSVSNYVNLSCNLPQYATTIDFLRTTTASLSSVGTQSLAVAKGTGGTTTDVGSALASYTFNNVVGSGAIIRLNNRDYSAPRLEFAVGNNATFGALPLTSGGRGVAVVPPGTNGAQGLVYAVAASVPVANLNGGTGYAMVSPVTGKALSLVMFGIVARGGSTGGCTDLRIGDSNNANALVIDPVANLTNNQGNSIATSTITQTGFGYTPFTSGLGINIYKTGSACTTATSFDVMVQYTVNPGVN